MEALTLQRHQITAHGTCILVTLPITKTGKRTGEIHSVTIDDLMLVSIIARLLCLLCPSDHLLQRSSHSFRTIFAGLLHALELNSFHFTPYRLWKGGATAHWMLFRNMDSTIEKGRWSSVKTARIYLKESIAVYNSLSFPAYFNQLGQAMLISLFGNASVGNRGKLCYGCHQRDLSEPSALVIFRSTRSLWPLAAARALFLESCILTRFGPISDEWWKEQTPQLPAQTLVMVSLIVSVMPAWWSSLHRHSSFAALWVPPPAHLHRVTLNAAWQAWLVRAWVYAVVCRLASSGRSLSTKTLLRMPSARLERPGKRCRDLLIDSLPRAARCRPHPLSRKLHPNAFWTNFWWVMKRAHTTAACTDITLSFSCLLLSPATWVSTYLTASCISNPSSSSMLLAASQISLHSSLGFCQICAMYCSSFLPSLAPLLMLVVHHTLPCFDSLSYSEHKCVIPYQLVAYLFHVFSAVRCSVLTCPTLLCGFPGLPIRNMLFSSMASLWARFPWSCALCLTLLATGGYSCILLHAKHSKNLRYSLLSLPHCWYPSLVTLSISSCLCCVQDLVATHEKDT